MKHSDPIKTLQNKLENCLRGSATLLMMANDKMYTPEERKAEMEAIEEWTHYVRDYQKNKQIIKEYNDMIQRQIDDRKIDILI